MYRKLYNNLTQVINRVPRPLALLRRLANGGLRNGFRLADLLKSAPPAAPAPSRLPSPESSALSHAEEAKIAESIQKSIHKLLRLQHEEGFWLGELECDVSVTADWVLLMHILGRAQTPKLEKAARWILQHQNSDGGWPVYFGGPSDLNCSVKCYFALKLCGRSPEDPALFKAQKKILWMGGIMKTNVFTKIYLALFGQFDWRGIPAMPIEMIFFPRIFYFNIYELSYWARTILVPLLITVAKRPCFPLSGPQGLAELYLEHEEDRDYSHPKPGEHISLFNLFVHNVYVRLDTLLKLLERVRIGPLREAAIRRAERWMLERFEKSGGLGAIWPSMMNSAIALKCLGYSNASPQGRYILKTLEGLEIEEGDSLRIQPCLSPVWDTAMAVLALRSGGLSKDHPALVSAGRWLLSKQARGAGDWQKKVRKRVEPGGWYFEFENEFYPDVDDTAVVLMALNSISFLETAPQEQAIQRGLNWVLSMQNPDGGWGAFDHTESNKEILNQLPFATPFWGALLDPSTADVTARVIEAMSHLGHSAEHPQARRALAFLEKEQEKDGSWYGRWGVNYLYGTWSVLSGLSRAGIPEGSEMFHRAAQFFKEHQNADGGWGETCITYNNPQYKCMGESTASQTAWSLMGMVCCGEAPAVQASRAAQYLMRTQRPDGSWQEDDFTGTGFPRVFYLKYHMYSLYFPLMALGRFRQSLQS